MFWIQIALYGAIGGMLAYGGITITGQPVVYGLILAGIIAIDVTSQIRARK